jgi:uroporphyrinogen-III synthase
LQQELIMASNVITILSTRPVGEAALDAAAIKGISIDEISFIETETSLGPELRIEISKMLYQPITVAFTSMHAVEAVGSCLNGEQPGWQIFCIGNTTRQLVKKYFGEDAVAGIADSATELADVILDKSTVTNMVFFCGQLHRDELPEKLRRNNIAVEIIEVYRTKFTEYLIDKDYNGILFFSPSAVQSFFSVNDIRQGTILFAIGNTTAAEIKKYSNNTVITGGSPGKDELVNKMTAYFSGI